MVHLGLYCNSIVSETEHISTWLLTRPRVGSVLEEAAAILFSECSLLLQFLVLDLAPTTGGGFRSSRASESAMRVSPASA